MVKKLLKETIRAIHDGVLAEENITGELPGRLDAVYGRIEMRVYYLEMNDVFDVAAVYCSYIAHGHPFNDGNKRTAFGSLDTILALNGFELNYSGESPEDDPLYELIIACAVGPKGDKELAAYLRTRFLNELAS